RASNPFDLAGSYPLSMKIVGTLESTGSSDDEAIFTSMKTAWIASGFGHGHEANGGDADSVIRRDDDGVVYGAALTEYQEITDGNRKEFHFHDGVEDLPVSGALVVPIDLKSGVLLEGRFQDRPSGLIMIHPDVVVGGLMEKVMRGQRLVLGILGVMSCVMLCVCGVVMNLSVKLRAREFDSLVKIGAGDDFIRKLILVEAASILLMAGIIAIGCASMTYWLGRHAAAWVIG
ncbi:hypothetical protein N9059_01595, partial [bacterium]|nr:hypothetical protein [bacterium]